jgi:hypothetical protein
LVASTKLGQQQQGHAEEEEEARDIHKRTRAIRNASIAMICLLFLQYLLGMSMSLFVAFPGQIASVNPLDSVFTDGPYLVLLHIIAGLTMGLLSIGALVLAARARSRRLILLALGGLGAILLAGESGIEFVLGWYSDNLFSFFMSFGFILSFIVYFLLLRYAEQGGLPVQMRSGNLA